MHLQWQEDRAEANGEGANFTIRNKRRDKNEGPNKPLQQSSGTSKAQAQVAEAEGALAFSVGI